MYVYNKLQPLPCKVPKNKQLKSARHILFPLTDVLIW